MADNNVSEQSFPVVGIGASAGGFDSLQRFLSVLPPDFGFSLVFIQHLSSKHKSLLPELLAAKRPSLVIQEISDGLKAEPGRLYLSPPAREIRLQKGIFRTTTHPEGLIHLPIDEFLASLAEDAGERSIAVIFSGAGTDGVRGCQAVRAAGGSVFVQDPETAEFSSMPLAAIATGQADAVLSPENICRELLKVQGIGAAAMSHVVPITPEEFDAFFRILLDKTGGRFNHYKKSVVGRRLRRRMYLHGIASVKDYLDLVQARPSEAASLASDLMIGVTSFFRDRAAWKALTLEVVRKLAAENADAAIRIWTAASATGEEAYSITMLLSHELALAGKKRDIQVFATDVNDRALEQAREGRYPASISADVPREYIDKYFTYSDDGGSLIVTKEIRERVVFAKQDLLTDPPFSKLDLIICRNFLIYLEPEAQEKSIKLFHYALNSGGYLFLGNAETVGRKSALFKSIGHKQCRVYRKLDTKTASRLPISVPYATERQAPHAKQAQMTEQGRSVMEIIQEKLLEVYGPACVAIDQNYEIIYHNGPTNRYLRQPRGVPTHNLLTLLPENLRSRMRGAIYRANHEEKTVTMRASLPIAEENSPQPPVSRVKNRVHPSYAKQSREDLSSLRQVTLRIAKAATNLYIVVFQEKGARSKNEIALPADATVIEETVIHQLESELSATRADLQSHIEQLKSLNEELQSSNEELQAANEELETSREELQSLNEELITVNSQLQGKIEEQDVTNNDLNNFQTSTNIPMIFLDTNFRVKRFTPAMLKLIMLLPSDVGRPIVDMSQENLGPGLTSDAQAVLESLAPARRELEQGSAWYVRTTLPYRTADNRIEGVVITYNDVTELKRAEECSRHLATFPQLNPNPVLEVDASGKVLFANPATERVLESLGLDKGETAVFLPKDLDAIVRALKTNSESFFPRDVSVKDRVFSETVQLIPQFNVARIYAYDITERKRAEEVVRRLAVVVQTTNDAVIIHDFEGNITSWNKSAERMYGYAEAEALKMKIRGIIPPDKLSETLVYLEKLRLGESVTSFETKRLTKEGRVFDVWLTVTVLFDEQGKPAAVAMTERDITERRNANEALRESEQRVRRKLDSILTPEGDIGDLELSDIIDAPAIQSLMDAFYKLAHVPIGIIDLKGKVLVGVGWQDICTQFHRAHPDTCRHCIDSDLELTKGISAGEFKLYKCKNNMWDAGMPMMVGGQHIGNLFWGQFFFEDEPLDRDFFRAQARQYGFNEEAYLAALERVPRISRAALDQGMAFYRKLADLLSKLSYGNIKLARSLAQRDALTASLRVSQERLNRAQEIAHLGSWELDLVENRLFWSDEVYRIFGLKPQEFGATYEAFLERAHPDDREAVNAAYTGSLRDNRDTYELEHRVIRQDTGETRIVHEKCEHFRDGSGKIIRSVGMVHDVTERKEAENEVLKLSEDMAARNLELEVLNRELEAFVYSVSHDLRAPLRSVSGFAKIIMEDYAGRLDDQGRDHLARIYNGSEKMSQRIEALLRLTKISRQELDRAPVDLSRVASTIAYELGEANGGRELEVVIAPGLTAYVDLNLIKVVLSNLLENAWKFTSKTDHARIELGAVDSPLRIAECGLRNETTAEQVKQGKTVYYIRDNGAGFDPAYADRMFWPFHRLHSDTEFEGTGIGLAIVERVIRRHGGRIWAEGEPGKGAAFYFTL